MNAILFAMNSSGIKFRFNKLSALEVGRMNQNAHGGKSSTFEYL